jgi:hypothetical protein
VSLENPDVRRLAMEDPRSFLQQYPEGLIIDEIQRVPELLFLTCKRLWMKKT